ncbi:MAG: AAA family ATPase [Candidatus Limnocylindria bacterium]
MPEQRKLVTVLFADIVGSTSLGETFDPEIVRAALGRYFTRTEEIAATYAGAIEKFIGDAIVMVFGAPVLHEDDAERAVRAGLAIQEFVKGLDRDLDVGLRVRIGINSGEAVVAEGPQQHFPITGDAINVAARLQQHAEPGDIVVGGLTERLTRGAIDYGPEEAIVAKGKAQPIPAFRLIAARTAVPVQARGLIGVRAALVGRQRELRRIAEVHARAVDERTAQLVTIVGVSGIGKSRLVFEALAGLRTDDGTRVLRGRCLPYGTGIAYWPLMDLVRHDAGITESDDAAAARAKLHARLSSLETLGGDTPAVEGRLAILLSLDTAAAALPSTPIERVGAELSWGVRRHLEALAAAGPLVAVIDDVQWADEVVVDIVEQLLDQPPQGPLLLLCMARPELFERHPRWGAGRPDATFIRLEPFDAKETQLLISNLLDIEEFPEALRDRIVERSEGNPLFCEEFLRMLIDDGRIVLAQGRWRAAGDIGDVRVPETILALLGARVDGLPAGEKAMLQAASVVGERFTVAQLGVLIESPSAAPPEALVRRGLLLEDRRDPETPALRFKHLLIRDVAYSQLPKGGRADLHDRLARHLEGTLGDRSAEFSELVAHHALRAWSLAAEIHADPAVLRARAARAVEWTSLAGDRALGIYATATAASYYTQAIEMAHGQDIDVPTVVRLYQNRGRALELRGAFAEAQSNYRDMEGFASERGEDALVALALAHQATLLVIPTSSLLDTRRGEELLAKALGIARASADLALVARLQWNRLNLFFWSGRLDDAWSAGEEAVALARELGLHELLAFALNDLARSLLWPNVRVQEGERALLESRALFDAQDNKAMITDNLTTRALWLLWRGDLVEAGAAVAELRRTSEASDNGWGLSATSWLEQELALEHGEIGRSIERGREAVRLGHDANNLMPRFNALADIWSAHHLVGADEVADEDLRSAAELSTRLPAWGGHITGLRARRAATAGRLDEARMLLEEARRLERNGLRMPSYETLTDLAEVEIDLAARDIEAAVGHAAAALARYEGRGMRLWLADLEWSCGESLRLRGDLDAARGHFVRAVAHAEALDQRRLLWRVHASRALVEEALGDRQEADAARVRGREAAGAIQVSIGDPSLVERFRALALVRSVFVAIPR